VHVCEHSTFWFDTVKVIVLESDAGWAGYLLNCMDAVAKTAVGRGMKLKKLPSYYFYRQCWISGDPDEKAFGRIVDFVGADKFFWVSDFPHPDHPSNSMIELAELVDPLSEDTRRKVLGENVRQVYNL
jgi:predicted TIM-barrel fold metal-dependent hydrolase